MKLHGVAESFVGTGAIAFAPGLLHSQPSPSAKKRKKDRPSNDKDTTNRLESNMSTRRTINEWLPTFKGQGYNPGDYQMPEPSGNGVADRNPTQDTVGAYDTDLSGMGKEWPREGSDTEAMTRVDDENISNSAEGAHESTHGEPNDGHQKKVGHDWPNQPKNAGQGVAELFGGERWSDGGTLQGRAPGGDTWTHTDGPGMPSNGPITGTSGPQLGQVSESAWTPDNMARLMGEDFDVKGLFDSYARSAEAVCVEDFQQLLDAHGANVVIDESSLLQLMNDNQEFLFHEGCDANGPYWVAESLMEGKQRRPFAGKRQITEGVLDGPNDEFGTHEHMHPEPDMASSLESEIDHAGLEPNAGLESNAGLEPGLESNMECPGCGYTGSDAECPECGVETVDTTEHARDGMDFDTTSYMDSGPLMHPRYYKGQPQQDMGESRNRVIQTSPATVRSLKNFMESARSLIGRNPKAKTRDLAEALNQSWSYYAGRVNARTCPSKVRMTLEGLMKKFPGFNPLVENEAMNKPEGGKLGGGDGPKDGLPKQPTNMTTNGDKNLLGKKQTGKAMASTDDDGVAGDLWLSGTEKKLTGRSVSESAVAGAPGAATIQPVAGAAGPAPVARGQTARPAQPSATGIATKQVQENIQRLGAYIKKQLSESAKGLGFGKYTTQFSVLVVEGAKPAFLKDKMKEKKDKKEPFGGKKAPPFGKDGKAKKKDEKPDFLKKNRTPNRDNLAEALADAEEILQLHDPADVTFEATFFGPNGQVAMKQDVPLFTINSRGPMVGEGKALFRFHRNAEAFAEQLVSEGVTCRVVPHNWGSAVEARTNYPVAQKAFEMLAECGNGCATIKKRRKQKA